MSSETAWAESADKIEQQQLLLGMMEDEWRLATGGERAARLEQSIEQVKEVILGYQVEAARRRLASGPADRWRGERRPTLLVNVPYPNDRPLAGRPTECLLLDDWLQRDTSHSLLALLGPDGAGKSALAWHWLQGLLSSGRCPPLVAWWDLRETETALPRLGLALLRHFGEEPQRFGSWLAAANRLVEYLARTPALLILDGVEALLAEDLWGLGDPAGHDGVTGTFLSWLARPGLTSVKTLLTSQVIPQELAGPGEAGGTGVMRHDLTGLRPAAAQEMLACYGVEATLETVEAIGRPVNYHPLSLRLLAGLLAGGREAADLAACYGPSSSFSANREVVLSVAYYDLPPAARQLLGRLAAFRGSVTAETLAAVAGQSATSETIQLLLGRGWLCQVEGWGALRYGLHPVISRLAYGRLGNDEYGRMNDEKKKSSSFIPHPSSFGELEPVIDLYYHLVKAGRYEDALTLYRQRLADPLYGRLDAHTVELGLLRALFPHGEDQGPSLADENGQAWVVNSLGSCYSLAGRPATAVFHFERSLALYEKRGQKRGMVVALGNLAQDQIALGHLPAANKNLRRSLALSREVGDSFWQAVTHQLRGRLLAYAGDWTGVAAELDLAQSLAAGRSLLLAEIWSQAAWAALLRGKGGPAWTALQEARRLAPEGHPHRERTQAKMCWLLGWAELQRGNLAEAGRCLAEAYGRAGGQSELELVILLAQARLAWVEAGPAGLGRRRPPGLELAQKARWIGERGGYVLHLADVHNLLAQMALDARSPTLAGRHAALAQQYATGEDPSFAYALALVEAKRLQAAIA